MVQFYKHDIAQWRSGTVMLSDRAYRVYHVLVEEIMLSEGPVPLHERSLAGKSNRSVRDFNAALAELSAAGKVSVHEGFVHNSRAEKELGSIRANRDHASKGGRRSGESRKNTNENNDNDEAALHDATKPKREEKIREDKKEISQPSVARPKPVRTQYPDDFLEFWNGYPTDANMSKKEAFDVWKRMDSELRAKATESLPAFRAYCDLQKDYRPIHANRYLLKERFEGFLKVAKQAASCSIYVHRDDVGWQAWDAFYRREKGKSPPQDAKGGWYFPTQFPPTQEAAE